MFEQWVIKLQRVTSQIQEEFCVNNLGSFFGNAFVKTKQFIPIKMSNNRTRKANLPHLGPNQPPTSEKDAHCGRPHHTWGLGASLASVKITCLVVFPSSSSTALKVKTHTNGIIRKYLRQFFPDNNLSGINGLIKWKHSSTICYLHGRLPVTWCLPCTLPHLLNQCQWNFNSSSSLHPFTSWHHPFSTVLYQRNSRYSKGVYSVSMRRIVKLLFFNGGLNQGLHILLLSCVHRSFTLFIFIF